MIIVSYIILCLCFIPDLTIQFSSFGAGLHMQLAPLFLCYLIFRRSFLFFSFLLFFYVILAKPFTGLGFSSIFFSFFLVFGFFHRVRTEIYIESYIVQAFWVFLMLWAQWVLLYLFDNAFYGWWSLSDIFILGLTNSLFMALICMPFFLAWDFIFDKFSSRRSYNRQSGGSLILEGKHRSKLL